MSVMGESPLEVHRSEMNCIAFHERIGIILKTIIKKGKTGRWRAPIQQCMDKFFCVLFFAGLLTNIVKDAE